MAGLFQRCDGETQAAARVVKTRLLFGEAAHALGLNGSSRVGWSCPHCHAPEGSVKETGDHKGGRCRACGEGFDVIALVRAREGVGFARAVAWCEDLVEQLADRDGTGDLFG